MTQTTCTNSVRRGGPSSDGYDAMNFTRMTTCGRPTTDGAVNCKRCTTTLDRQYDRNHMRYHGQQKTIASRKRETWNPATECRVCIRNAAE